MSTYYDKSRKEEEYYLYSEDVFCVNIPLRISPNDCKKAKVATDSTMY